MLFPRTLLDVADRLVTILMTLVDAIYPIALGGSTPTFADHAAQTLFLRLAQLVATLIRISHCGIRAPGKPATTPVRTHPAPSAERSSPAQTLPRHPGWLLAALPEIAPAIASDLAALLADPALTTLLATAPTLHRTLRGLDLAIPDPPTPPPQTDPILPVECPAPHQPNRPTPITEATVPPSLKPARSVPLEIAPTDPALLHAHIVTITKSKSRPIQP